jgi:Fe-S cluster assembly protein SufD
LIIGSLKKAANNESIKSNLGKTKLHKNNLFTAINSAYATDGACIIIPDNYAPENPIHIVNFVNGDNAKIISQSRNLIYLGKNAQAKVINTYHSLSSDFTFNNVGTEIFTEDDANLHYYIFQGEGNEASQINNTFVEQKKGSFFKMNTSTLCGSTVRNELHVDFKGEHCEADLQGIYLPDKEQHADNFVSILHSKPNCVSGQLYKGIIDNNAKSVFTGKVYVARDAQNTDASQSNKNLLLTDNAKAYSRPQLEIYADDVSCAHGSTTGQIDKEELFYLKSRGIPERRAKTMLMTAFIEDVLNKIEIKQYKEYVQFLVNRRLKGQEVEGLCSVKICPNC